MSFLSESMDELSIPMHIFNIYRRLYTVHCTLNIEHVHVSISIQSWREENIWNLEFQWARIGLDLNLNHKVEGDIDIDLDAGICYLQQILYNLESRTQNLEPRIQNLDFRL